MKNFVFIGLLIVALTCGVSAKEKEELYDDKYDYVDVDMILANDNLRKAYYKCLMEDGPCLTPDAKILKERLPEVFATKCGRCTERQKISFDKIASWAFEHEPENWNKAIGKFLVNLKKKQAAQKA